MPGQKTTCTAFAGGLRVATGSKADVAREVRAYMDRDGALPVLVFDDTSSAPVELDLRGTPEDVERRYAAAVEEAGAADSHTPGAPPRGRGRPKLGVIGKEVTLLPRHWAWLSVQRGGASATIRRLVDQARREAAETDRVREAQDSAYRFMLAMVGNEPGFEEATRALYARDGTRFEAESEPWAKDVRAHARRIAEGAFAPSTT